jgi:hypothetical protein
MSSPVVRHVRFQESAVRTFWGKPGPRVPLSYRWLSSAVPRSIKDDLTNFCFVIPANAGT